HLAHAAGVVTTCDEPSLDAALAGGGLVTFSCGPATITITSTKVISLDTTIDGGGNITISGGHAVGVFRVNSGVTVNINNLTIVNGYATGGGAGIYNAGTLNLTNSIVSSNDGAGDLSGTNGGGISNFNTLTVTNSTFSDNTGTNGGAIISVNGSLS